MQRDHLHQPANRDAKIVHFIGLGRLHGIANPRRQRVDVATHLFIINGRGRTSEREGPPP